MFLYATLGIVLLLICLYALRRKRIRPKDVTENSNKSVFITGCDTGIGHVCAKRLHSLGFKVFAGCLQPDGEGARKLQREISGRLRVVPLDITDDDSVKNAAKTVKESLDENEKGLYGLVNNAGILIYGQFDWITMEQIQTQINVNLVGTMRVVKHFLDIVIDRPGRIVNITSINGKFSYPGLSVYCATKFGLEAFSDALRYEMKKFGVLVSIVEPGDLSRDTNIFQAYRNNFSKMLKEMDDTKKMKYKDEMENVVNRLAGLFQPGRYEKQSNGLFDILLGDIEHALMAEHPKVRYVSATVGFRIGFFILTKLPTQLMDTLMEKMVKRQARKVVSTNNK
ncbi:Uncharacterised protein g1784 [Pycnogonum litorale]